MSSLPLWDDLCIWLVSALGHFLWQGALVGAITLSAARMWRNGSASVRYGIYLAGMVILAICPVILLISPRGDYPARPENARVNDSVLSAPAHSQNADEHGGPGDVAADVVAPVNPVATPWSSIKPDPSAVISQAGQTWRAYAGQITATYLAGVLLMIVRTIVGMHHAHALRCGAELIDAPNTLLILKTRARALGLKVIPPIAASARVATPCVIGALRPIILIPTSVLTGLSAEQLGTILAHELAHLRRNDHWVCLFQKAIETFLFFHPMVWWLSRRLSAEREICCDDLVVAQGGSRSAYAESLVRVAEICLKARREFNALAAVAGTSELRMRLARILQQPLDVEFLPQRSWWSLLPLVLLIVGPLVIVAARQQTTAPAKSAQVVFEDACEQAPRNEWSIRRLTTAPSGTRTFLGPFESGVVQLPLRNLPDHAFIRVSFDLVILGSWDGDATQDGAGPDVFALVTDDGRILHFTSFATGSEVTRHLSLQGFPGLYGVQSSAARSGAIEQDTLGFRYAGMPADAVYHFDCVFPHTGHTLELRFIGSTSSLTADETWGLDNVRVVTEPADTYPAPSAAALAGAWEQLRSDSPAVAMAGVATLVRAGDSAVRLIADRIQGQQIPIAGMLDPFNPILIPSPPGTNGIRFLTDPSQRRIALAAHILQQIGTDAARKAFATAAPLNHSQSLPRLHIAVRDSTAHHPLPGLPIRISDYGSGAIVAISDDVGRASVQLIAPTSHRNIGIQVAAEGYIPIAGQVPFNPTQDAESRLDIDLESGVRIGGFVVDDAGAPVKNATVLLEFDSGIAAPGPVLRQQNPYLTAVTDKDGRWTYDNAPRNRPAVSVGLYHPQYATHASGLFTMEAFADVQALYTRTARMTLVRGTPIEGVVLDPGGHPVPHAILSWGRSRFGPNLLPDQTTDEKGRFHLAGYPGETVYVTVKAIGFAPEMQSVLLGNQPVQIQFNLSTARTLTGKVVSPDGVPIAGAMLYLNRWRGTNALDMRIFTDGNGRFIWDAAPGDEVYASVSRAGYRQHSNTALNAGSENVIVLDPIMNAPPVILDEE